MGAPMKGTTLLAFGTGVLAGAFAGWWAAGPSRSPAPVPAPAPAPLPTYLHPAPGLPRPTFHAELLEEAMANIERDRAAALREARANILKGALVLEIGGRTPEQLLEPWKDIEPERGTVRFSSDPEGIAKNPWMTLATVVPEEFEEALARSLDNGLRWVEPLHLAPKEAHAIRLYTEGAYRLMVDIQQRQAALRRMLADPGRFSPEERKTLSEKLQGMDGLDHRIYVRSNEPGFRIPLLFPPAPKK